MTDAQQDKGANELRTSGAKPVSDSCRIFHVRRDTRDYSKRSAPWRNICLPVRAYSTLADVGFRGKYESEAP